MRRGSTRELGRAAAQGDTSYHYIVHCLRKWRASALPLFDLGQTPHTPTGSSSSLLVGKAAYNWGWHNAGNGGTSDASARGSGAVLTDHY